MQILVKENHVVYMAPFIDYGVFDEPIEKWRFLDEEGKLLQYAIDDGFTLVDNVTIPEDYADGKYFFENGEFVLNEEWKPYRSFEERIEELEAQNADSIEIEADLMYELALIQLGLI